MLSSNMLLLNLILLIDVTFSTPTPVNNNYSGRDVKLCGMNEELRESWNEEIPSVRVIEFP